MPDLYRSCKSSKWGKSDDKRSDAVLKANGTGSLSPDYVGFTRGDGSIRDPDVTTFKDLNGVLWVRGVDDRDEKGRAFVDWKEGVSVSTQCGGFGYRGWFYFLLPEGTSVPASLDIKATPSRRDTGHHSIRCKHEMRQDAYEGALSALARSAIAKAVELSRASLYFS